MSDKELVRLVAKSDGFHLPPAYYRHEVKKRFDRLYLQDRYKHGSHNIDIIYPRLGYPGNRSLMMGPDKVRTWPSATYSMCTSA